MDQIARLLRAATWWQAANDHDMAQHLVDEAARLMRERCGFRLRADHEPSMVRA